MKQVNLCYITDKYITADLMHLYSIDLMDYTNDADGKAKHKQLMAHLNSIFYRTYYQSNRYEWFTALLN